MSDTNDNNLYASPASDVGANLGVEEPNDGSFLSVSGRIGRLRYIAYFMMMYLLVVIVGGLVAGLLGVATSGAGEGAAGVVGIIVMVLVYVVLLVYGFIYAVRRLNDIGWSGFLSLLLIVPLANLIMGLLLLFMPGQKGPNQYGNPAAPNTWVTWVMAILFPIAVVGILAAIAIPQYNVYKEKAMQKQLEQQGQVQQE